MKNILKKSISIFLVLAFAFEMFFLTDVSIQVEAETMCEHAICVPITYDSSCERNGMTCYVCVDCDEFVGDPIPILPKGHSFGDWITEKEPTCTTKGLRYSICSVCDKRQDEDIPEKGHSYKSTEIKPTCTEEGFTRHVCTTCNASYSDGYTEAMGHDFAEKTIAPTCENKGYTLYTCSRSGCGYSTKDNYIDALGHIYRKQTVPSTCEEKGYTLYTCKYCGDNFKDNYKDQTGHLYGSWTIDFSPTCSQEGQKSRTCSACGNKETEAIDKTDHNYNKTVISPTCTENGYTENICSECGDYYIDNYVETSGHSYGKWNVTEATVLEEGSKSRICTVCEYVETETIPRVEINIEENSNYGLVIFTIVKAQSEPVSGAKIFISTEKDGENTFTTDKNGKVSVVLPVGEQKISVYADGCKIRNPQITVNPGVNELHSIALSEFPVYDVKFKSQKMTLEEMREAGVDTTAEGNKQSYKYELKLDFDPEVDAESIVACFDADGNFIGGHYKDPTPDKEESEEVESGYSLHYHVVTDGLFHSWCKYVSVEEGETVDLTYIPWREDAHNYIFKGWYEDSACTKDIYEVKIKDKNTKVYGKWEYIGPEEEKAEKPKGIRIPSKKEDITVYPVSENFYLIIRGEVSWIKEMFDVQMLVINNSDNATLENLKAELTLPEGLSLAEMVGEQQELTQEIETIEALGSRSVNWYVRGDTEGSYSLEANLTGEICEGEGITEHINDRFVCENQIQVWAGSALHLNFEFPNATYYGDDYPIKITLENVSDKELYGVNHKVQIEQGMEIFYSDGTSKSKIEKSSWEHRGVSVFKPGDKLIIETSVNIFFESEILEKELEKYSGIVDGIETFLAGYKAVKIGIKAWNSFCKTMTGSISALKNFEASTGSSEDKVELFRQLHDKLSGLYTSYGTSGNKAFDAAVSVINSGLGATLNAIAKDPDDWLTNHAKNDVEKVLNDVEKLGDSLFEDKETDTSFDIFDSIRTFISAIPIRFVLSSVIMREDENNTTSIPWDYTVSEASPQYFGVTNVSKYLMSLLQAGFSDSVSQYLWLLAGVDDPFNKTDAVKYIKATENEIAKIKAKDATGKVSFKAWVERGSSGTSDTNDFVLSCDNDTAEYTDGVLSFTGDGMISVMPQNSDSGTLFIEDSEGNLYTYVLDVVGQHKCASTQNKTVVCPFEGNDGFAVKRCDVCEDILDVIILEQDSTSDDETLVNAEIQFGTDRFSFGEDMTGCVGDTLYGLLVYTSAGNDVSSLTIESSNTNVVEVGTVENGKGEYISQENEHKATVQLKLKSKGTSEITITSPEGISESVTVTVGDYINEGGEASNFICRTNSTSDSLIVGTNIKLMVGYYENGKLDTQAKDFDVVVSDNDILSVKVVDWNSEYGREYTIVANDVGTATVSFTNPNNNESFYLKYQVVQAESCFTFDNLPEKEYEKGKITHFYNYGGMVINDFKYSTHKNENGVVDYYNVTMNVYNSKNMYGAVTVYDENGKINGYYIIDRHKSMPESFTETVEDLFHNTKTLISLIGNKYYYSGEDVSTLTEVEIDVPAGGYVSISNNATTSEIAFVANYTGIMIDLICNIKDYATISATIKGAENKIIDAVTGKLVKDELMKSIEKCFKEEIGNVNWSYKTYDSYINAITLRCQDIGINLVEIIKDEIATVTGIGEISESIITNVLPTGWIINLLYAGNGTADYALFLTEVSLSQRNPQGIYIYSPKTSNEYVSNNVIVQPQGSTVDAEKVVHTYKVYDMSEIDMNLSVWGEEASKHSKYTIHNITMYKNGEEVQPDSEVVVKIPIPVGYNKGKISVYHIEEDGTFTNMFARVIDGYAVFKTKHFSYYMIADHTIEHVYVEISRIEPSCTTVGTIVYGCKDCNNSYSETVPVVGHAWSAWEVTKEPTITEDGIKMRVCSLCGATEEGVAVRTGITVTLTGSEGNVVFNTIIDGDRLEYEFCGFEDGKYTATFEKTNYVTRVYDINITAGECVCEIDLHLRGDINGDGKVNTMDVARANAQAKGVTALTGYELVCADINGDGKVNTMDVARINAHAKGVTTLW